LRYAIGIDLGGTHIKAAGVSESGEILDRATSETRDRAAPGAWVESIRGLRARIEAGRGAPAAAIGVAAPGLAAADGRSIASIPGKLAGLQGLDWAAALGATVPVRVLNDGHAALLGECWRGAAAGCRDVVLLTLGTGVGGAILSGGRLLTGATGKAGHWGHMTLDPDGPPSIAGMPGSLEGAIGNCTIEARSHGRFHDTKALVEAHLAGDAGATRVWRRSVYRLACAVASIANAVDPEIVILGGGIARAGEALLRPLEEFLAQVEWRPLGGVRVTLAALGEMAGALGAAQRALEG
jgi:glucokinase